MEQRLKNLFDKIEAIPLTLTSLVASLFVIITIRIAIEFFLEGLPFFFSDQYFYKFLHFFFTFGFTYLAALPIFVWFAGVNIRQAAIVLLFGFLVIWIPPLVDEIISQGIGFWSFYAFDSLSGLVTRYFTFFGDQPEVGITYGVRTEVALVLIGFATYVWVKTKSFGRVVFGTLSLYTVLFLIGALPSLVTFILLGPTQGWLNITELDIARVMLSPEPLYLINPPAVENVLAVKMILVYALLFPVLVLGLLIAFFRTTLLALWNNIRLPQAFYHIGLFLVGAGCVILYERKIAFDLNWLHWSGLMIMLISVVLAWITSVIVNDLHDVSIDTVTNPNRPLITNTIPRDLYQVIGFLTFTISIIFAAIVSTQLALLLVGYQAIAWIYSASPLRLKRYPFIATILASSASLLVFFGGYIVFSTAKNIAALPNSIPLLLFLAYTFLLPIKDFKDIPGDKADGVITWPILLGEARAKRYIGSVLLLVFIVSVFVFQVRHLFPLALFFGSLAYWLLQLSSPEHRYFSYRRLSGWYIALVSAYTLFLVAHFISTF